MMDRLIMSDRQQHRRMVPLVTKRLLDMEARGCRKGTVTFREEDVPAVRHILETSGVQYMVCPGEDLIEILVVLEGKGKGDEDEH